MLANPSKSRIASRILRSTQTSFLVSPESGVPKHGQLQPADNGGLDHGVSRAARVWTFAWPICMAPQLAWPQLWPKPWRLLGHDTCMASAMATAVSTNIARTTVTPMAFTLEGAMASRSRVGHAMAFGRVVLLGRHYARRLCS